MYRVRAAKNLPNRICVVDNGDVISSSMVPLFFSSANSRIVSMGTTISQMKSMTAKNCVITISLRLRFGMPPCMNC